MTAERKSEFGKRLRWLMTKNDLSEIEISLQTPAIGQVDLENWVAGRSVPDNARIAVLADYFGCDENWLATGKGLSGVVNQVDHDNATEGIVTVQEFYGGTLGEISLWIDEQDDGINYWEVLKAMLAREYPDFREWLKKRRRGKNVDSTGNQARK